MKTMIVGVFRDDDAALTAAERAREAAGQGASIRVLMAGDPQKVTEASITWDRSDRLRVTLFGWMMGLVFAVAFAFLKIAWIYSLVGVLTGASVGVMLGIWLTGEQFRRRPLAQDGRFADMVQKGRALVLVDVDDGFEALPIARVLHDAGGQVYGERSRPPLAQYPA